MDEMNQDPTFNQQNVRQMLPALPSSNTVLVLGILSIVGCWCFGLVGLIMGIIALVMSGRAAKEYTQNFGQYSEASYKNLQAGKICAIIGTCLSAIASVYYVIYLFILGTIASFLPWKELLNM